MKVQAKAKYLKISAQKLRLAADLVRDMNVVNASDLLMNTNKKAAGLVGDTLKSAVANAENNLNLSRKKLHIHEIRVDEGPKLKRFRPRARGMAGRIEHKMAHLTIVLDDESTQVPAKAALASSPKTAKEAK